MLKVTLRGLMAHKVRLVATALAVLLGVAFMTGTQVLTSSVSASFDKVFADVYASIDVVVRSSTEVDTPFGSQRTRVDGSLVPTIEAVDGVKAAEGQVVAQIRVLDKQGEPLGLLAGAAQLRPQLAHLTRAQRLDHRRGRRRRPAPTDIVLDAKSASRRRLRRRRPDRASRSPAACSDFTVVGIARFGKLDTWGGAQAALFETSHRAGPRRRARQVRLDLGRRRRRRLPGRRCSARIAAVLPPGTEAITGAEFTEESQDAFQKLIAIFNTFLLIFALIALFVGSFIIYNTFSIIVAQRTRELALLRAVGASRRQVLGSVLLEAFVVGLGASAIGVVAGIGLAMGLNALLRNIGFAGPETPLVRAALGGGLAPCSSAPSSPSSPPSSPPARAATIAPVAAMRDLGIESDRTSRRRAVVGGPDPAGRRRVPLARASSAAAGGNLQQLGVGALAVFLGMVVLGPVTGADARPPCSARPLPRLVGVDGRLAVENAIRSPKRTATTASALMIGVGLVGFIAVTAQSVKASTTAAIDASVQGQYVDHHRRLRAHRPARRRWPRTVRALPEVRGGRRPARHLRQHRRQQPPGAGRRPRASSPSSSTSPTSRDRSTDLDEQGVAVSQKLADDRGLALGQQVTATFLQGGTQQLTIEAIYDTRFPVRGPGWLVTQELFDAQRAARPADRLGRLRRSWRTPRPPASPPPGPASRRSSDAVPGAELQDIGEFQQAQSAQADQFLLIVYVLLALALVIAIVGVVNTLLLSVHERTRELGPAARGRA